MEEIIFASGSVPVAVAARVYGKDASWIRAGIVSGWLPIGKATRSGKLVTNLEEMYVTLNDFYYELGLDGTKMGDMLGWSIDKGYIDLAFSSQLDANGTPCLVIDYQVAPVYDYQ